MTPTSLTFVALAVGTAVLLVAHLLGEAAASRRTLDRALVQTVEVLAAAVLHRDPATSRHQRRVADLAVAVGRALGLAEPRLRALELAGLVHDVGQIEIPGEILARPGPLSTAERELVKLHAETGHSLLKNIELPWPLAETVYQHHENLDGTGYPRGLRGDEISLDARILRACDVVEAMSSHRPFRETPGTEAALREIERMAGRQLDPAVVAAILALFRDGGYAWPEP